jgi:hypothetical protein
MVPASIHDFFVASCSVAGALIGLLFVAISVAAGRLNRDDALAPVHRMRAASALTAFTNALSVSLFALIPGQKIGPVSLAVAVLGMAFVAAAVLSVVRQGPLRWSTLRELAIPLGMLVAFVVQLLNGIQIIAHPDNPGDVNTLAIIVSAFFLAGIARSYELIGGPSIGLTHEVTALVRTRRPGAGDSADGASS